MRRGKWADWKQDMNEGVVFVAQVDESRRYQGDGYSSGRFDHSQDHDDVAWPHRAEQCLVMTRDGMPPRQVPDRIAKVIVEDSWRRIYRLKEVVNIYDLGFWDNLIEVLKH